MSEEAIDWWLRSGSNVVGAAADVAIYLCSIATADGVAKATLVDIAHAAAISEKRAVQALERLEREEWLSANESRREWQLDLSDARISRLRARQAQQAERQAQQDAERRRRLLAKKRELVSRQCIADNQEEANQRRLARQRQLGAEWDMPARYGWRSSRELALDDDYGNRYHT